MLRLLTVLLFAATTISQSPLVTTFANNAAGVPNGAVYFDLTVNVPAITITRLDLNVAGSGIVEVWTKQGSRVGAVTTPSAWTLSCVGGVNNASGGATIVSLPPFVLQQGTHGIAIRGVGVLLFHTVGNGANQNYANAHLSLAAGEETFSLFAPPVFAPRVVNTAIHYLLGELVPVPAHTAITTGGSRGYHFVAQTPFNIRQLALPANAAQPGSTASYLVRINGHVVYRSFGNAGAVEPNVHVATGDHVDVLGNWTTASPGSASARNSIAGPTSVASIHGVVHSLQGVGWSWDVGDPNWVPNGTTGTYQSSSGTTFGRVLMTTEQGQLPATNTKLGNGCILAVGSCYDAFGSGAAFDLQSSALTFSPQPGGGRLVSRQGTLLPVGATGVPVALAMQNDNAVIVPLTTGSFPGWSSVTVAANGFIARGPGNGGTWNWIPEIANLLDAPEEAYWAWHDFDPSVAGSGLVKMEQSAARTVITWDGVWHWLGTSPQHASTVQFQLYPNGVVTIAWGSVSPQGPAHLVGYSPGGPSPDAGPTDFSALGSGTQALAAVERFPLALAPVTTPVVGGSWSLRVDDVPVTAVLGVDVLGLSDPGIDDLAMLGAPGCGLRCRSTC